MKVYVVTIGMYDDAKLGGVYSSPERAMAAHPPSRVVPNDHVPTGADASRPGGWMKDPDDPVWSNGLDWGDCAVIEEYEVDAEFWPPKGGQSVAG